MKIGKFEQNYETYKEIENNMDMIRADIENLTSEQLFNALEQCLDTDTIYYFVEHLQDEGLI